MVYSLDFKFVLGYKTGFPDVSMTPTVGTPFLISRTVCCYLSTVDCPRIQSFVLPGFQVNYRDSVVVAPGTTTLSTKT